MTLITEAQFVDLYTHSFHRIKCFCARFDYENQEDLAQKTFQIVWEKRDTFRGESRLSTWVFAIALNVCRNEFRKSSRYDLISIDGLDFPLRQTQYSHVLAGQVLDRLTATHSVSLLNAVTGTTNSQYERNLRYRARQKARSILA